MLLFVPAYCGPDPVLFFFLSYNPFQTLAIVAFGCSAILFLEVVLLFLARHRSRLLSTLCGLVGLLSLGIAGGIAGVARTIPFVCEGIGTPGASTNLERLVEQNAHVQWILQLPVTGLCLATLTLLIAGTLKHLQWLPQKQTHTSEAS